MPAQTAHVQDHSHLDALLKSLALHDRERDWERLITEEGNWLRSVIRQRLDDADLVEDCLQDVLVSVHGSLAGYVGGDSIKARGWLKRICLNMAENFRQSGTARIRREQQVGREMEAQREKGERPSAESDRAEEMRRALLGLPETQRRMIELRYLYGLSTKQVANELGLQYENTKRTLTRALASLRKRLGISAGTVGLCLLVGDLKAACGGMSGVSAALHTSSKSGGIILAGVLGKFSLSLLVLLILGGLSWVFILSEKEESAGPAQQAQVWQDQRTLVNGGAQGTANSWEYRLLGTGHIHSQSFECDVHGNVFLFQSLRETLPRGGVPPESEGVVPPEYSLIAEKLDSQR